MDDTVACAPEGELRAHEMYDAVKFMQLENQVKEIKENIMTPAETVNLFTGSGMGSGAGMGAGAGAGLGAGLLGGILGSQLLGRNGLVGAGAVDNVGVVTPTMLTAALAGVTEQQNNTVIQQTLGDIKAAIPYNEAQVQLALAGAQADINNHSSITDGLITAGFASTNRYISDSLATAIAGQGDIKTSIAHQSAVLLAASNAVGNQVQLGTYATTNAIRDDGDKTRALIISQNDAMLNRQLATAESALLEQRAISRSRDVEVNVTQTVNQNQQQLQLQQQQQQQFQVTSNLLQALLNQAQVAQATNQQLIIGNSGVTRGGDQTANPVNVRA